MNIHQAVTAVKAQSTKTVELAKSVSEEYKSDKLTIRTAEEFISLRNSAAELLKAAHSLHESIAGLGQQYKVEITKQMEAINATK